MNSDNSDGSLGKSTAQNDNDARVCLKSFFDAVVSLPDGGGLKSFFESLKDDTILHIDENKINELIAEFHCKYCEETVDGVAPYEDVSIASRQHMEEDIKDNAKGLIAKKLLYALHRIFLHKTDVDSMIKVAMHYVRKQSINLFNEAETEAINSAVDKATIKATDLVKKVTARLLKRSKNTADELETRLSTKTAEVSVTILGIFAGIVLSVVGGLIYSSSVLQSINSASYSKLLFVSSSVGFVIIAILATMFSYIDRFRSASIDKNTKKEAKVLKAKICDKRLSSVIRYFILKIKKNFFVSVTMITLVLFMIVGLIVPEAVKETSRNGETDATENSYGHNEKVGIDMNVSVDSSVSVDEQNVSLSPSILDNQMGDNIVDGENFDNPNTGDYD